MPCLVPESLQKWGRPTRAQSIYWLQNFLKKKKWKRSVSYSVRANTYWQAKYRRELQMKYSRFERDINFPRISLINSSSNSQEYSRGQSQIPQNPEGCIWLLHLISDNPVRNVLMQRSSPSWFGTQPGFSSCFYSGRLGSSLLLTPNHLRQEQCAYCGAVFPDATLFFFRNERDKTQTHGTIILKHWTESGELKVPNPQSP